MTQITFFKFLPNLLHYLEVSAQPGLQKGGWSFFARFPRDLMLNILQQKSQFLMKVEIKKPMEKFCENRIDC